MGLGWGFWWGVCPVVSLWCGDRLWEYGMHQVVWDLLWVGRIAGGLDGGLVFGVMGKRVVVRLCENLLKGSWSCGRYAG